MYVKGTVMKQSIIILLLLAATNVVTAADAKVGKVKAAMCTACHGGDGNSINPIWPNLAGQSVSYLAKQMKDFRDGKRKSAQMAPMVAALSDEDIGNIAAYFSSQKVKTGTTKEEFLTLGSQLYNGGIAGVIACTGCHGPTGAGLDAAGFPQLAGQQVPYTIAQLATFKDGTRSNDNSTMMNSIAGALNDEQIEAVANYIAGLH
jgi:cbb3-type cytochrome c oxidase subunit III